MISRGITERIMESLAEFPSVGIVGARQVGKTTLSKVIANRWQGKVVYLDLERASDLAKLEEAELFLESCSDALVVLDEIQRKPELFPLLRALVDSDPRNGKYLILGSASPDLIRQSSESLAGRIYYYELAPFILSEIGKSDVEITRLWSRGGYPRSFLAASDIRSFRWRESFIQTHLERDIPNLGLRIPATTLFRFWQMIAHSHGQVWNASKIANSLGISSPTVRHYVDILQDTFMIRQLQPFHVNVKKRLVKSPKVYIRDSGILHTMLGLQDSDSLMGHPAAGTSWEGWVIEQVMGMIPSHWKTYFYRTSNGTEIDLIIQPVVSKPVIAVEIKRTLAPVPTRGFWNALSDLQAKTAFVIYPGKDFYPLGESAFALPITDVSQIAQHHAL